LRLYRTRRNSMRRRAGSQIRKAARGSRSRGCPTEPGFSAYLESGCRRSGPGAWMDRRPAGPDSQPPCRWIWPKNDTGAGWAARCGAASRARGTRRARKRNRASQRSTAGGRGGGDPRPAPPGGRPRRFRRPAGSTPTGADRWRRRRRRDCRGGTGSRAGGAARGNPRCAARSRQRRRGR